ncbi:Dcc1p TDEL_0B06030 [Torulaspora delbrueckii]|uniref:Sister chromatid cohesion protein DCC1 n=1 Tax=Torulaspora delbrueckii TaxID=4950 RepID=G8ZQ38_TORDE|nr:hypothetical protein TDEL_0B06030 [Torulaspora delbrueckii]CCE90732.1 hypothetical protein TDEL_0B06030 [Torulaspora delbrueckii]
MSKNLYSKVACDSSYKLVQLTPDLLEALQRHPSESQLEFKALDDEKSDVVICSRDKTWLIKQKNHSNTVMLMREFIPEAQLYVDDGSLFGMPRPTGDLLGFCRTTYEYETRLTPGRVNLDLIPVYGGELEFPADESKIKCRTLKDLLDNSPSSEMESRLRWNYLGGCEINGFPCILSREFMTNALHVTLMSVLAESLDFERLHPREAYEAVGKDMEKGRNPYVQEVVETVLAKFGARNDDQTYKLNKSQVAGWYGLRALQKFASSHSLPLEEFLIKWKSTFPPFAPFDIDIQMLKGWYFQPVKGNIQYVSKDTLPMETKDRFKMLFKLQSQWDLDAFEPFVEELNTKGLKIDTFIMKYARKRRVGKKVVVSSRSS